jgi:peroxiredoxin
MRLSRFTIPFSIALFLGGLALYLTAKPASAPVAGIDFDQPEHPVTPKMTEEANKMERQDAKAFARTAARGELVQVGGAHEKPQFVLFILDGCPCSIDAQPIFNAFAKHWKDKVEFVGVIDSEAKKARAWMSDYRPVFPVVSDPKKEIIHAYQAKQSVYSALISKYGTVIKLWPGYSTDLLKEMNDAIAKELAVEPVAFDAKYAPKEKISGCYF